MRQVSAGSSARTVPTPQRGGVVGGAEVVGVAAGFGSGDPLALAGGGGDTAVERGGEFQGDHGAAVADAGEKAALEGFGLGFQRRAR